MQPLLINDSTFLGNNTAAKTSAFSNYNSRFGEHIPFSETPETSVGGAPRAAAR